MVSEEFLFELFPAGDEERCQAQSIPAQHAGDPAARGPQLFGKEASVQSPKARAPEFLWNGVMEKPDVEVLLNDLRAMPLLTIQNGGDRDDLVGGEFTDQIAESFLFLGEGEVDQRVAPGLVMDSGEVSFLVRVASLIVIEGRTG